LIADLVAQGISTVGEGGFQDPVDVQRAFDLGAFAVVVGTAITDPVAGTRRLVAAASGD